MTIVVTGGGSGGHITPILAVASELKRLDPSLNIVYIGQTGERLLDIVAKDPNIDAIHTIRAGKLRRYHGEGWKQLLALPTQFKNLRDLMYVLIGTWQSFWLLGRLRPQVIFTRGGFVSVPVALAASRRHIPFITHDSDSVPSLANRLIARWAALHTVALPAGLYPYPLAKTLTVGIPLQADYRPVNDQLQAQYKHDLQLPPADPLLLITGGGNGARQLNEDMALSAAYVFKTVPRLRIVHIAGKAEATLMTRRYDELLSAEVRSRVQVIGFTTDFYRYSGAADVIIARGGATNLAEFALQAKACIVIPAERLVGGHQVKNAQALADARAIVLMTEAQAQQEQRLGRQVNTLLNDATERQRLGKALAGFALPDAAERLAMLLLEQANHKNKSP